jgi:hypothetical protein
MFTLPIASLPTFIADQASALSSDVPAATSAAAAPASTPKAAQAVKELQIQLDPGELGEMTVKLRLAGGKLSVTIGVANPQTLAAIEDDRALIAARLGAAEQSVEDIVIQRQVAAPPATETSSSHAFASEAATDPSATDGEPDSSRDAQRRSGASARGGAGLGGRFSSV